MNKTVWLIIQFFIIIYLFSCSNPDPQSLATFDGGIVTIDEYISNYLESTRYKPNEFPDEIKLKEIVEKIGIKKLLVLEGIEQNIESDTAFIDIYNKNNTKLLFQKYMRSMIIDSVITDSLIQKYYNEFSPQYQMFYIIRPVPKSSPSELDQSQKDVIYKVYAELQNKQDFHKLAEKYSQDITTNKKGGDLGWVIKESLGDKMLRAAMDTLKQGAYTKPVRGYEGWYILFKGKVRTVTAPPFNEARGRIWQSLYNSRKHIMQDTLDARYERIKDNYNFQINHDVIYSIIKSVGSDTSTPFKYLNFSDFPDKDFDKIIATYKNGKITAGEIIRSKKKSPDNYKDFQDRLKTASQQHIIAQLAKSIDLDKDPQLIEDNEKFKEAILENLVFQKNVRNRAIAKVDSLKPEIEKTTNPNTLASVLSKQQMEFEKQLKQEFEDYLKVKFNFEIVESNISRALKIATERKNESLKE